jgi:hypothetical protein
MLYVRYQPAALGGGGGSGGVTTLNGESGAITLVGGTGISITPAGQNITITNTEPSLGGTVTSVGLADGSTTPIYTISGSPVTAAGTLTFTLATQTANTFFAGPATGSAAQPTFRAIVAGDLPNLSGIYVTQSEVGAPSGVASLDSSGKVPVGQLPSVVMEYEGAWNPNTNTPALSDGTGTNGNVYYVTAQRTAAVAGNTDPSMVNFQIGDLVIYSSSVGKWQLVTPAAGVSSVNGAQGAVTVNAINQLTGDGTAGPASGSASAALTLAAVNSNIGSFTNATLTVNAKGLVTAVSSGTGVGSVTSVGLAAPALFTVSGSPVTSSGTLTLSYSGTALPVANGGTGQSSALNADGIVYASSTTAMATTTVGTAGQVLTSNGTGVAPTFQTSTAGELGSNTVSYTPVWTATTTNPSLGTTTTNTALWRRVGEQMVISYVLNSPSSGGSPGSGIYLFALPTGFSIDTTKLAVVAALIGNPPQVSSHVGDGTLIYGTAVAATNYHFAAYAYDSTHLTFSVQGLGAYTTSIFQSANLSFQTGGVNCISFTATVPIVGWSWNS